MTDTPTALIDVLVCTYQRPELLRKTLDGIARCAATVESVRIVVVDNDHQQSARELTRAWAAQSGIPLEYFSQPQQNISLTRNVALDKVTAPWIAMIDDDEVPDPDWLSALLAAATRYDADVVFGPVISLFDSRAPAWATHDAMFQRKRFATGTAMPLKEMRTANSLLRASRHLQDGFRFDPVLGLSGGEDSELFARMHRSGYSMVWCDEACVREWTPPSRTTVRWVLKRTFRIGSVDAFNRRRSRRLANVLGGLFKYSIIFVQGMVQALLWAPLSRARSLLGMRRAAMAAGFWYGLYAGPYLEYRSAGVSVKHSQ
ncbi:glycosyltransferase family 2 protein [Massilia sp. DWR3-1-1]|uniref:glycosyltransferase family 2 protein n=1 Tax=Massilia sp. DWR3-1-1 TaxID=2804559 RepID=UPI003CE8BD7F